MSAREGKSLLPASVYPAGDLGLLRRYTSSGSVNGAFGAPVNVPFPMSPEKSQALKHSWWQAVRHDPRDYLATRFALWCGQIGLCSPVRWVQHPFIDPNPWGYHPQFPALDHAANRSVASFATANL